MGEIPLNKDSDFLVREEKILNYILASLCFALFLYGLIDAIVRRFVNIDYQSFVFAIALVPAYLFFKKARSSRVYIRINKTGIYQDEKLLTAWTNFFKAYLTQKKPGDGGPGMSRNPAFSRFQDNFMLVVEYKKDGQVFRRGIPLTNTQNKSEEDVLAAVQFFWKVFQDDAA